MAKSIFFYLSFIGLLLACDACTLEGTGLYEANEYTPTIGTLDVKQKVKMDFIYEYTDSIRRQTEFFDVPDQYLRKLKGGINPTMNTYTKDRYFFISDQSEFILHMDYTVNHDLINVYWPEKDTIHWLTGNDVGNNKKLGSAAIEIIELKYNQIVDSLVNIAKRNSVSDEEIFWHP